MGILVAFGSLRKGEAELRESGERQEGVCSSGRRSEQAREKKEGGLSSSSCSPVREKREVTGQGGRKVGAAAAQRGRRKERSKGTGVQLTLLGGLLLSIHNPEMAEERFQGQDQVFSTGLWTKHPSSPTDYIITHGHRSPVNSQC